MTSTTVQQDIENLYSWDFIVSDFDEGGVLTSRFTRYDNGTTRTESFEAGNVWFVEWTDFGSDEMPNGARSWERLEITYDENGDLAERYQLNDNGIQSIQRYDAGVLRVKSEFDFVSDAAKWDSIYTYYDQDGVIERREETRDDGVQIYTFYENGVRRLQEQTDFGQFGEPSDARIWETLEIRYDEAGQTESRYEVRDDGVQIFTQYENGVRRLEEQSDRGAFGATSDARVWETLETRYDEAGKIESRFELRDDGVQIFTQYENGVRRLQEQADFGPFGEPSDARIWETIETRYDEAGTIESRYEVRDDGVQIYTEYENGVRRLQEQSDFGDFGETSDARIWETLEFRYDQDGKLENRYEVRDNGVQIYKEYDSGVQRFEERVDHGGFSGASSDAEIWDRIEIQYDETGQRAFYFELRDTGQTIERFYVDGKQSEAIRRDVDMFGQQSDAEAWDQIFEFYDENGVIDTRETLYDDGDVTAYLFDDGRKTARYDLDGDNSEVWETREILYDLEGNVISTTYDIDFGAMPS